MNSNFTKISQSNHQIKNLIGTHQVILSQLGSHRLCFIKNGQKIRFLGQNSLPGSQA